MNRTLQAILRAEGRAGELGYRSLEECIRNRISQGNTVFMLALQLDVSQKWLKARMDELGVITHHKKNARCFWKSRNHDLSSKSNPSEDRRRKRRNLRSIAPQNNRDKRF